MSGTGLRNGYWGSRAKVPGTGLRNGYWGSRVSLFSCLPPRSTVLRRGPHILFVLALRYLFLTPVPRLCAVLALQYLLLTPVPAQAQDHPGKATYDKWCGECHGAEGRGDGAAAATMLPRPRDFTQARYQIRTTASGALPTDADLHRILEYGMPGTAMPAWTKLSQAEREQVISYIKTFSRFFQTEPAPAAIEIGSAPGASEDRIAAGKRLYERMECWKCHGREGRGDGPSAPTQEDENKQPIRPANLTQNWHFNGGGRVEDIYTRMRTGIDGTPMPSFSDLIDAGLLTADSLWNIALYVRSLSPQRTPEPAEVIRATLTTGDLPQSPDDATWERIEPAYVPLVGQIVAKPRWFAPTVTAVWVQAVHNGRELAIRLSWDDPSRSPDPAWEEWRTRVTSVMEPKDAAPAEGPLPDAFTLQFPTRVAEGRDLPYFLNGDSRTPVYLWEWRSDSGVREAIARGMNVREPLPADGAPVRAQAKFTDGRWQVVLHRTLAAQDTTRRITLPTGTAVPIAFYAWDGSNGESGGRGSISSWYFLHLNEPATASVFITPVVAAAITALLGIVIVMRAQKQYRTKE